MLNKLFKSCFKMPANPLKREIITTKDGSKTLFIPELNEQYHSVNGAVQESMHVFINAGFKELSHLNKLNIFEVGFGTGLNALLSFFCNKNQKVFYHGIEKYPLASEEYSVLDFPAFISKSKELKNAFITMHECLWNKTININSSFELYKEKNSLEKFSTNQKFDLIYFDAFAPEIQPDLWTVEVFKTMFDLLLPGGILVTYCAKGQVRRNMQEVGFKVERIPGPPGKRQMMRAIKN